MPTHVQLGPGLGRLLLRTGRKGIAAQAGHDLTIEVTRWSGELVLAEDVTRSTMTVTAQTGSLRVVKATGGAIPLSEWDKRQILGTARRLLDSDRQPRARFTSTRITQDEQGGGVVEGTLTLLGQDRPLRLEVGHPGEKLFVASGSVVQSQYGIKPYTAMLGALRVADPVAVRVEVDLSGNNE
jgi:polyisoprenoid-binding protein YceI